MVKSVSILHQRVWKHRQQSMNNEEIWGMLSKKFSRQFKMNVLIGLSGALRSDGSQKSINLKLNSNWFGIFAKFVRSWWFKNLIDKLQSSTNVDERIRLKTSIYFARLSYDIVMVDAFAQSNAWEILNNFQNFWTNCDCLKGKFTFLLIWNRLSISLKTNRKLVWTLHSNTICV